MSVGRGDAIYGTRATMPHVDPKQTAFVEAFDRGRMKLPWVRTEGCANCRT